MGILDDAIREHLDLQRRRGADPGEVERAEREALGPVRRNREAAQAPDLDEDSAAAGSLAYDQEGEASDPDGEEDWTYDASDDARSESDDVPPVRFADDDRAEPELPPISEPAPPPAALASPAFEEPHEPAPAVRRIRPDDGLDEPLGTPEPFPADPSPAAPGRGVDETAEYDIPEALRAEDEKDEDVLEETPEFLQDTPDHDRLWFEQRPPRDFDFDS
jgi:hypothetical protein